jgi:hypothetical protein
MTEYEKVTRIHSKSLIPQDIVQSDLQLQSYLEQNVIDNRKHESIRQRVAKAQHTRIRHSLEAAARKIQVEPTGPVQQQTKTCKFKRVETPKEDSRFVKETRTGIRVICDHCGHSFVHFSKNLYSQYFCSCSRCHLNIRLRHYKLG